MLKGASQIVKKTYTVYFFSLELRLFQKKERSFMSSVYLAAFPILNGYAETSEPINCPVRFMAKFNPIQ